MITKKAVEIRYEDLLMLYTALLVATAAAEKDAETFGLTMTMFVENNPQYKVMRLLEVLAVATNQGDDK